MLLLFFSKLKHLKKRGTQISSSLTSLCKKPLKLLTLPLVLGPSALQIKSKKMWKIWFVQLSDVREPRAEAAKCCRK